MTKTETQIIITFRPGGRANKFIKMWTRTVPTSWKMSDTTRIVEFLIEEAYPKTFKRCLETLEIRYA